MLIGGIIIIVCVLLLILAFLFPRLSRRPEHGAEHALETGARGAGKAPGRLGRWFRKPFTQSEKAVAKSTGTGRRGRSKMPF